MAPRLAGYQAEIRQIEQDIAEAGAVAALDPPTDTERFTQICLSSLPECLPRRRSAALGAVERAIDRAMPLLAHPGDLYLLKANVAFKLHRLAMSKSALLAVPSARAAMKAG